jgi:hypothetical protein
MLTFSLQRRIRTANSCPQKEWKPRKKRFRNPSQTKKETRRWKSMKRKAFRSTARSFSSPSYHRHTTPSYSIKDLAIGQPEFIRFLTSGYTRSSPVKIFTGEESRHRRLHCIAGQHTRQQVNSVPICDGFAYCTILQLVTAR